VDWIGRVIYRLRTGRTARTQLQNFVEESVVGSGPLIEVVRCTALDRLSGLECIHLANEARGYFN
jgi:hypothetical protein